MGATAKRSDCDRALADLASSGGSVGQGYAVYERACKLKSKRYGCGLFGTTAATPADHDTMGAFALCEAGHYELCEDYASRAKSNALIAWLTSLKTDGCRNGAQALCPIEKECRGKEQWGCDFTPQGTQVCGCLPVCEGPREIRDAGRTWKDGTRRGRFSCVKPP